MPDEPTTEEVSQDEPPKQDDGLKNMKSEFDRKFQNLQSSFNQSLQQIQASLESLKPAEPEPSSADADDIWTDPDAYLKKREQEIESRVMGRLSEREQRAQNMNKLVADFPELANADHPLTQKLTELLPGDIKNIYDMDPSQLQAVVYQAAAYTGLQPASVRRPAEEFSFDGSEGGGRNSKRGKDKDDLDPVAEAWASEMEKHLGRKIDRNRIKEHSKRSFGRYKPVKS